MLHSMGGCNWKSSPRFSYVNSHLWHCSQGWAMRKFSRYFLYPCQMYSSASGRVCDLTPASQWPAFRVNRNWYG
jgi:hypothetical protein